MQSKQGVQQWQSALLADLSRHILTARADQSLSASQHKSLCHDANSDPLCLFINGLCFSVDRFCVGDKFFLKNNMILCQMDYEEGQLNGSFETQVQ